MHSRSPQCWLRAEDQRRRLDPRSDAAPLRKVSAAQGLSDNVREDSKKGLALDRRAFFGRVARLCPLGRSAYGPDVEFWR